MIGRPFIGKPMIPGRRALIHFNSSDSSDISVLGLLISTTDKEGEGVVQVLELTLIGAGGRSLSVLRLLFRDSPTIPNQICSDSPDQVFDAASSPCLSFFLQPSGLPECVQSADRYLGVRGHGNHQSTRETSSRSWQPLHTVHTE